MKRVKFETLHQQFNGLLKQNRVFELFVTNENLHEPLEIWATPSERTLITRTSLHEQMCLLVSDSVEDVKAALDLINLFDLKANNGVVYFEAVQDCFCSLILSKCSCKHMNPHCRCYEHTLECYAFELVSLQDLKSVIIAPKEDFKLRQISESDSEIIGKEWSYETPCQPIDYIRSLINSGRPGIVVEISGKPVSWALQNERGVISFVHTIDVYRNKGYSKLVIQSLSHLIISLNHNPCWAFVVTSNSKAIKLFESLGFTQIPGKFNYIELLP